ncbi:MAG: c-type cytochrome [Gammaproteobacteria bacterium]|nr:c-type cytochrome [Gammaproteobacteria bacterium]MBU1482373.1 c-type cytochrome [Gammaproteobacteria bacterium]
MKKGCNRYFALACSALFGLYLSNAAFAADVAKLVEPCFSCHGKNGNSADPDVPNIASYSEDYLTKTLKRYQDKERPCIETEIRSGSKKGTKTDMCKIAAALSEDDIDQIGGFFVAQTFERTPQAFDAGLAEKGKSIHNKRCYTCHSEGGSEPSDHAGILAGQKMAYLRQQIKFFREGKRPMNKKMKPKLEATDDSEIEAVINYYGSFK